MNNAISRHALALCLFACASPALAQEADGGGIQEIVVTAQKRSESLQKTPISMMAMTGADIEKKGIADIKAMIAKTSGDMVLNVDPNDSPDARPIVAMLPLSK